MLSRIRGSGKAALVPEEGNGSRERERESGMGWGRPGEQGQCWEHTQSKSQHQMLGKMLLTKKVHEKISRPRAGFNDRHQQPG
jgi:hypothetical protein